MNPSLLPCLMGRVQGKLCGFNDKCHFLGQKQQIQMVSAMLSSPLGWSAQGRGCRQNERAVTLLSTFSVLRRLTQSSMPLRAGAKAVPLLLPKAHGSEGATQGITRVLGVHAWGWRGLGAWDDHSLGEFTSRCKISSSFGALWHRFSSRKGPGSETIAILAAVELIGCPGAKVKLKYISKCLRDQDLIQA